MWRIILRRRGVDIHCRYAIDATQAQQYVNEAMVSMANGEEIFITYVARKVRVMQGFE